MSSFLGMDVQAVRQLASQLNARADEIESLLNALSTQLGGVDWRGPDAEAFRNDWNSQHRTQLTTVAAALRDAANRANVNANQQEQASA